MRHLIVAAAVAVLSGPAVADTTVIKIDSSDGEVTIDGANNTVFWNRERITCEELKARLPFLTTLQPPAITPDCRPAEPKPATNDSARKR